MDRGVWWATVYRAAKSWTRVKHLTTHACTLTLCRTFQVALVVKNPPANAGDMGMGLIPLIWEDPLEEGLETHSSILAWRIPWTEVPDGLQSMGSQRVGHH